MAKKRRWIVGGLLGASFMGLVTFAVAFPNVFFYRFDQAAFVQLKVADNPNHQQTAVLATRVNNGFRSEADILFLLVGNKRVYTRDELSRAFHLRTFAFEDTFGDPSNLHMSWTNDTQLVVSCTSCQREPLAIERRRAEAGTVHITYVGIPPSPFKDQGD